MNKKSKKILAYLKPLIIISSISILIAINLLLLPSCRKKDEVFETFEVKRGDIIQTISTTGYIDTTEQKGYSIPLAGKVIKSLQEGDYFKKDEIIFQIEDNKLKLFAEQAEENLKLAQSSLNLAKLSYQQALDMNHIAHQLAGLNEELSQQATSSALTALDDANRYLSKLKKYEFSTDPQIAQAVSQVHAAEGTYLQSITNQSITYWSTLGETTNTQSQIKITGENINQSEIQLNLSKINLELVKLDLENTAIYAPFDGIVLSSLYTEGSHASPGIDVISIIKDDFIVRAEIDETDIGKIKAGQDVEIRLDAYYDKIFKGRIKEISPISKTVAGVVSFEITISLEDTGEYELFYGLSASLNLTTTSVKNVLYIPIQSVYEENGKEYVDILTEDGQINKVVITTGFYSYDFIEVKTGLKEGDIVITGYF